ncbi:phosphoprotein phosphatase [Histomonas meleagridis]|uniref:phosphoprotein phosphatase n=1 Tax=Histomonas meleagridis TaxID=135588 RepID=UPI00355A37C1|nr:phosphoprotein phosphatase [Histomonas meleagridis]KAH0806856.1 phosphoprotein phosphatase [Histomonas meleagridis]
MILNRYIKRNTSMLTLPNFALSTSAFKNVSFHTTRSPILEPLYSKDSDLDDEPYDEVEVPNRMMTVTQFKKKHHRNIQLPYLPLLKIPYDQNQISLLEQKINLCCTLCDFTDIDADKEAKAIKTATLKELMNIFASPTMIRLVAPEAINKFFDMIIVNITRPLPPIESKHFFLQEEPQLVDVAWAHLSLVYTLV